LARKIKSGDTVLVTVGKDRGKIGKVKKVYPKKERILVEGVNIVKKHMRGRGPETPSGIVELEAPIHISNVKLVCPSCGEPTRVGFRFLEEGKKVRYCKKCEEVIE